MRLWLFALLSVAQADTSHVILEEDFESYGDTISMRTFWTAGSGQLLTNAPGGGQAVSHDGSDLNRHGGFALVPDSNHIIVLSADLYDFATNMDKRVTVSLRNTNGQSLDLGLLGPSCYVARVMGFGTSTNWVPFKKSQTPVPGWHRFRAVLSLTNVYATLDLNAEGTIDQTLDLPLIALPAPLTQLRFGGLSGRPSRGGPVLVDNLKLEWIEIGPPAEGPQDVAQSPASIPFSLNSVTNAGKAAPVVSHDLSRFLPSQTGSPPTTVAASNPVVLATPQDYVMWWILGALAVIIVLLLAVLFMFRRAPRSRLPAPITDAKEHALGPGDQLTQRLIGTQTGLAPVESRTDEQVGQEFTEFAKQALVQGLYSQRNALLETQRQAQSALEELENRLTELQLPVQDRIHAYEKRIAELEREVENRGDELRELTRATLLLVRQKLERERTGPRFN